MTKKKLITDGITIPNKNKEKRSYSSYKKVRRSSFEIQINVTNIDRLPSFDVGRIAIKYDLGI